MGELLFWLKYSAARSPEKVFVFYQCVKGMQWHTIIVWA